MDNNTNSYLTFKVGSEVFAVNTVNVQSIIECDVLTKVPEMPPFVIGIINLRGEVVMVIDSRIKLSIPVTPLTSSTCIIVLELDFDGIKTKAGILVDEVLEVLEIEEKLIKEPPSIGAKFKADIITGVFSSNNKFIMLLDVYKVVASDEIVGMQVE